MQRRRLWALGTTDVLVFGTVHLALPDYAHYRLPHDLLQQSNGFTDYSVLKRHRKVRRLPKLG